MVTIANYKYIDDYHHHTTSQHPMGVVGCAVVDIDTGARCENLADDSSGLWQAFPKCKNHTKNCDRMTIEYKKTCDRVWGYKISDLNALPDDKLIEISQLAYRCGYLRYKVGLECFGGIDHSHQSAIKRMEDIYAEANKILFSRKPKKVTRQRRRRRNNVSNKP